MYKKQEQGFRRPNIPGTEEGAERTGPPRRRTPYPPKQPKENLEIKSDTEVPPMPAKHEILAKPNWETNYKKDFEAYNEELKKLKDEKVIRPSHFCREKSSKRSII